MPRNEQGEYELVLGTPQLLSMLFIIVVLFGVVFSLGYFMGRSVAPAPAGPVAQGPATGVVEEKPAARPGPAGQAVPPAAPLEPAGASEPVAGQASGTTPVGGAAEQAATAPAAETKPAAPASGQTQAAIAAPSSPVAQPAAEPAAKSYPEPAPGQTFLQVAAVTRNEAELAVDMLKRKGFAALVAPGPNERLFRVLVGPLADAEEIAKTRKALEEAGFRSAYVRKY